MIVQVALPTQLQELPGMAPIGSSNFPIRATVSDIRQDWPARRTASVVFGGCNLACPYCFDPEHVSARGDCATVGSVIERIAARGSALDGVVLTGGEPTASSALMPLLGELATLGVPVKLDTNGTAPEALEAALAGGLVSFVALDLKTTPERYDRLAGACNVWPSVERSIAAVLSSGVDHEFRTTCYPFGLSLSELPSLAARLAGGKRYVLQQFVARRTLDPGASSAAPWTTEELRRAALRCAVHIPTLVRGV